MVHIKYICQKKMMIEYGEDHIFKYSINLENGIEMKID